MRKMLFGAAVNLLIIGTILFLEKHPNRYVENLLIIGRVWIFVAAAVAWLTFLGFWMRVQSPRVANMAATCVNRKSRAKAIIGTFMRFEVYCLLAVSIACGRWWFALCSIAYFFGCLLANFSAQDYMKKVKVDEKTKHATIDV